MKLVILDRDGVINRDSDAYVKSVDEWLPLPGSIDAVARLHRSGFTIAVATNQSGIARGYFSARELEAMHHKMQQLVAEAGGEIAAIAYCPHGPDDNCACRKPKPGLLRRLVGQFSASQTWVIGDSLRDLEAGADIGASPILVRTGKGRDTQASPELPPETLVFDDLAMATGWLIEQYGETDSND